MQDSSAFVAGDFPAFSAEWKTERLHSWKEIASFFCREVRTVQLWEKNEGLPVRRQHHNKLGSVYAYRRELEGWWIARSALSASSGPRPAPSRANTLQHEDAERGRLLLFPLEVVHSRRDRGPLQQIVNRFAGGLRDDINHELSRSRFDPVCLTTVALPLHGNSTPGFMRDIAQEFRAECYLLGVVRYAGNLVRVSIQLVRSADSVCIWSERFETTLDNVFQAQSEVAHRIVQALPAEIVQRASPSRRACAADHAPAYHAYMMGLHFWKQRTRAGMMKALGYFQDAVLIDPSYASAYAGLTDTYVDLSYGHFMSAREATEAAQRAVSMALKLEPKSVSARNAAVNFHMCCRWNWQSAQAICKELVDSGAADSRTYQLYASLMITLGRPEEAMSLALHAHRLDPLSDYVNFQVSFAYFYAGDYDSAVSFIDGAIALRPLYNTGHALLGRAEAQRGNWDKAIASFERGLALSNDSTFLKALLAYGYAGRGDTPIAKELLREIEEQRGDACFPAVDVSAVHAMLNRENEALQYIFRAYDLRDMKITYIQHDPRFARLRALPQFQKITSSVYVSAS
jgi:TolB-like protein/tetratricopeptide (TPR) repeat protein